MNEDSPYYSMHSDLPKLKGMTEQAAKDFVTPYGYKLAVIQDNEEMNHDGWTVSVRLSEGKIRDVFAWSRPVMRQSDSLHPDAWNDGWLDEVNGAKLQSFINRLLDPNDPFGKPKLRAGKAQNGKGSD